MSRSTLSAMSVISSSVKPDARRRAPGPDRSARVAAASRGARRTAPDFCRSCAVSRGKRVRATSGIEASTPTTAVSTAPRPIERLPAWNRCDTMPRARRVRARRRCSPSQGPDHLLDHPVPGLDHDRAKGHEVRIGRPAIVHRDREEAGRAEGLGVGGELLEVPAERLLALVDAEDRLEPRRLGLGGGRRACKAMASSVWV